MKFRYAHSETAMSQSFYSLNIHVYKYMSEHVYTMTPIKAIIDPLLIFSITGNKYLSIGE